MFKAVEVFRAGSHVDSKGQPHVFTEADLDRIAASYDPATHEAPAVIGHPKDNAPAYGWVEKVWRDGPVLKADFTDVAPEFADLVSNKRFKKRSISLYPDGTLRHVGFLGAVPPAVKGLKDVSFAEGEATTFEFGEDYRVSALGRIMVRLRDWIIAKFGQEAADTIMNTWDVEQVLEKPEDQTSFEEEVMPGNPDIMKQLKTLQDQVASFNEKLTAVEKENADLKQANADLSGKVNAQADSQVTASFASFAEGLVNTGRLTPAQRDQALALLPALSGAKPLEFSEADGKTTSVPAVDALKNFLEGLPVQVDFSDRANRDRCAELPPGVSDGKAFSEKIEAVMDEYAKNGKPISFAEAAGIAERNLSKAGAK